MPKTKRDAVSRKNVRVPTPLMDEVDGIVQNCGLYLNRQQFIESAIREKVERFQLVEGREATNLRSESVITALSQELDDDILVRIKEIFLVHITNIVKEKTVPADHLDLKEFEQDLREFEQCVRQYVQKRARREGKKITKKRLDALTEEIREYEKEILEGLSFVSRR